MDILAIIVILLVFIVLLIASVVAQMRAVGIKVTDFWSFINANQELDSLYEFSKRYTKMTPQQQVIYLGEAEKMFAAFDKIPQTVWEDDHDKYEAVLDTYKDIRVMRWNELHQNQDDEEEDEENE